MAAQYIELFDDTSRMHADDLALIAKYLSIRPGPVLDVGCGPGHLTEYLRSLDVDAIGLDNVAEFIDHARVSHPDCCYELGSMRQLSMQDGSIAGILAWYSLIHTPAEDLHGVLVELRRVIARAGRLVIGFFDGDHILAFDHKVTTAFYWPVDELSARLRTAGFREIERETRPGEGIGRAHGALVVVAI